MTATNKRLLISESRDDLNRCTPYRRKSDQHATRFPCLVRVWFKTIHISRGPHIPTFCTVINRFKHIYYCREEGLPTQPPARLSDPRVRTQLLSQTNHWNSGENPSFCWHPTTRFINTNMRSVRSIIARMGPNHRSLTDSGGGYSFEGAGFPRTTPRPFQLTVSTFHLRAPPSL
jgi:hypothetical protein